MGRISLVSAMLLLAGAAACGAELSPGATILQSIPATNDAGSARVVYRATFDVASAETPVGMSGEGAFDYAHGRGDMTFDISEILQQQDGPLAGASEVRMIFDGVVVYMRMPFLAQLLDQDRPWIRLDIERARREGRTDLAHLVQLGESDPTQLLELLNGVTRGAEEVGSEEVRGVPTTRYKVVLDLERAARAASEEARAAVASLVARSGSTQIPADVWIDEQGRMRRMTYDVVVPPSTEGGESGRMTVAMELYEFGIDVDVQPPPPERVIDLLQLLDQPQGAP